MVEKAPTASDVAAAVLNLIGPTDTFRLQKLVYYCQAWYLVWAGRPLFDDRIEAWANGPVIPALYKQHRGRFTVSEVAGGDPSALTEAQATATRAVVDAYGRLSGRQLAKLTHEEAPWQEARQGLAPAERGSREITLDSMAAFYSALDSDPEAELVEQIPPEPLFE
jgi:uncharacterized phage-associated protein